MKKVISLMLLSISLALTSNAQSNLVKGSKIVSMKFGGGKYSMFKYIQPEIGWCYNEKLILRGGMSFEFAEVETTKINVGRVNVEQMFNLFDIKDRVYFNAGIGLFGGFESIQSTRNPLSERNFVFGGNVDVELDFFVTSRFSIKAEFIQHYMQGSKVSPWYYTGTVGLSYVLN